MSSQSQNVPGGIVSRKERKSFCACLTSWCDYHRTKLRGRGRDWLINATDGTISPKHDRSFYLGYGLQSLKLVSKDSKDKVIFNKHPHENGFKAEEEWMKLSISTTTTSTSTTATSKEQQTNSYFESAAGDLMNSLNNYETPERLSYVGRYPGAKALPHTVVKYYKTVASSSAQAFLVKYVDEKFIATQDDYVLDVAYWKIEEGSDVNFIKTNDGTNYTSGGGRDWTWNKDGSLSPTLNTNLVIGLPSAAGLVITKEKDQAIKLKHAHDLVNGKTVPFELLVNVGNGNNRQLSPDAVGFSKEDMYKRWRYRLSELFLKSENYSSRIVNIKYDGNFILTDDESYALDIAFWKMTPGNSVNFVGGSY